MKLKSFEDFKIRSIKVYPTRRPTQVDITISDGRVLSITVNNLEYLDIESTRTVCEPLEVDEEDEI